jgi:hypothetical protein
MAASIAGPRDRNKNDIKISLYLDVEVAGTQAAQKVFPFNAPTRAGL